MIRGAWIVGFEGPCLAGKTTLIRSLEERLRGPSVQVLRVDDFTEFAGGHANFPPIITKDESAARSAARYFLELERRRRDLVDKWMSPLRQRGLSFVLVDRLIFTCMAIRRSLKDHVGYETYLQAVKAREVLLPDLTVFLELPAPEEERQRRMAGRVIFEQSNVLYNQTGYLDFLREIDATIAPLGLFVSTSEKVAEVEQLLLSLGCGDFDGPANTMT